MGTGFARNLGFDRKFKFPRDPNRHYLFALHCRKPFEAVRLLFLLVFVDAPPFRGDSINQWAIIERKSPGSWMTQIMCVDRH